MARISKNEIHVITKIKYNYDAALMSGFVSSVSLKFPRAGAVQGVSSEQFQRKLDKNYPKYDIIKLLICISPQTEQLDGVLHRWGDVGVNHPSNPLLLS